MLNTSRVFQSCTVFECWRVPMCTHLPQTACCICTILLVSLHVPCNPPYFPLHNSSCMALQLQLTSCCLLLLFRQMKGQKRKNSGCHEHHSSVHQYTSAQAITFAVQCCLLSNPSPAPALNPLPLVSLIQHVLVQTDLGACSSLQNSVS